MEENKIPTAELKEVFKYLSSQQVSQCRLVCKAFNTIGMTKLNENFATVCKDITHVVKSKSKDRWTASRHEVKLILSTNSILLMLRAVFGRYITSGRCCFYPGQVTDYAIEIVEKLKTNKVEKSDRRLLQRLYTKAKRAIGHFEHDIEPTLPGPHTFNGTKILDTLSTSCHLQAVETDRKVFFTKVCSMFPQETYKFRQNLGWLGLLRSKILVGNNSWVKQHLNNVKIENTEQKIPVKKPINKYGIPSKDMVSNNGLSLLPNTSTMQADTQMNSEENVYASSNKMQQKTESKPSTSAEQSSLNFTIANPDSAVSAHKCMSEDLIRTMVNAKKFMKESQNGKHMNQCEKRNNSYTDLLQSYKKYCHFEPYIFQNKYVEEETQVNKRDAESELSEQGFLQGKHLYQGDDLLLYQKQWRMLADENKQLQKQLQDNSSCMVNYKPSSKVEYNSETIGTISLDESL